MLAYKCTMGICLSTLLLLLGTNTQKFMSKNRAQSQSTQWWSLSGIAYFLTIPELTYSKGVISAVTGKITIGGWTVGGDSLTRLSTSGMFTAILMSILAVTVSPLREEELGHQDARSCSRRSCSFIYSLIPDLSLHLQFLSLTVSLSYLVQIFIKLLQFHLPL